MDPPISVQLDAGAPKAEASNGREHRKRSRDRQREKHKSHKNGHKEKSRHHDRKHSKSASERKHHPDQANQSPAPGGLESGEIDLPDTGAEVASASTGARLCPTSAAKPEIACRTEQVMKLSEREGDEQADIPSPAVKGADQGPGGVSTAKPDSHLHTDHLNRHEQSKDRAHGNGSRRCHEHNESRTQTQPSRHTRHDPDGAAPEKSAREASRERSRHHRSNSVGQDASRKASSAREARDRRMIERIGAERWDGESPFERPRSQGKHDTEHPRALPDRYTSRELDRDRSARIRDSRGDIRGDVRGDTRGGRGDMRDAVREDAHRGRSGADAHGHRDTEAVRSRVWERERDRGSAYAGRREGTRGGRPAVADMRGGERGRPRDAPERGGPRKRTRSVSPRTKAARQRRQEGGRGGREADEGDALAAFEDMMTAEEREAKELEERRRRRAELEAKLAKSKVAAAPASADGGSQSGVWSHDTVNPSTGQDVDTSAPSATAGDRSATGADAAAQVGAGVADAEPKAVDADDAVDIGSDADEQHMEDLFRAANQGPDSPKSAAAGEDDDDGDLFAEDEKMHVHVEDMAIDGTAEASMHDDRRDARQAEGFRKANTGLSDMYDDSQGYYNFRVGELMGGRYEVVKASGKGVFSSVVTATDKLRQNSEGVNPLVAIKVIRANDTMYKAGKLELQILTKLAEADPENRKHVIRLLRSFEYRHHLCMVFEHMEMNLRELTRKVGIGRGIRIDAVGQLALQMLLALKHLRSNDVLHADIKPDNILINARMNKIKLCDLGSATFQSSHNEPTPYLVSRFYRAPEVILGLPYDFPMDMWSIACTIYELFTADILFKGRNNNEMLKLILHLKGPLPKKMIRKGMFANQHFSDDSNLSFIATETDVVTKEPVKRLVSHFPPGKGFLSLLLKVASKEFQGNIPREERRKLEMFATFLDKATELDPSKRLTPEAAMKEKFIETAKQQITMQYNAHKSKTK
eukprot:jgi/Ulvmu1/9781/UM056_0021.1